MGRLSLALDELAPVPGSLVYMELKRSSYRINEFEPCLFSAIDVCTHLQLARYYSMASVASAVDFLEFISVTFPFRTSEVRTTVDPSFTTSSMPQSFHRFTMVCVEKEILHSVSSAHRQDQVVQLLSGLTFGGIFEGNVDVHSETAVINELENFLFFHNNYRSLSSLYGNTPVQKLKSFFEYAEVSVFSPLDSSLVLVAD